MHRQEEIFLLNGDIMESMPERPMREGLLGTNLEDALQTLLERHPEVIPGKQIASPDEDPPRFFLLRREMPVSGWSLDHLFVDQSGILTLIEAKLIQNPESRRDVIGQIVEYAANAVKLWANGRIRQATTEHYANRNKDIDTELQEFLGDNTDTEAFWSTVENNLEEGRLRLIIASDIIRPEVRRMIEYLNAEMHRVDVLGLELKCFGASDSSVILVPRIIGQTQAAIDRRTSRDKPALWTKERILEAFDGIPEGQLKSRLRALLDWSTGNGSFVEKKGRNPDIRIQNSTGHLFLSVGIDGGGYAGLAKHYFNNNEQLAREYASSLVKVGLLSSDSNYETIRDGRQLAVKIYELDNEHFEMLLKELGQYV